MSSFRGSPGLLSYSAAEYTPRRTRLDTTQAVDLPFQDLPLWYCYPPLHDSVRFCGFRQWSSTYTHEPVQITYYGMFCATPLQGVPWRPLLASGPLGSLSEQIPEVGSSVIGASNRPDQDRWDRPRSFTSDQTHVNSTGSDLVRRRQLGFAGMTLI
jgi:hypothetical protein